MNSMIDVCLLAASENGTFYLIISGILGLTAICMFFGAKQNQRVHQLMLDTKTSLIKDVAPGRQRLMGVFGQPLTHYQRPIRKDPVYFLGFT